MKTTLHSNETALTVEYEKKGDEYEAIVNGQTFKVRLLSARNNSFTLLVNEKPLQAHLARDGQRTLVAIEGRVYEFSQGQDRQGKISKRETGRLDPEIRSPMPGKILQVLVQTGAQVEAGQILVVVEAMKMENALTVEGAAYVKRVHVSPGELVELGQILVELEFIQTTEAKVRTVENQH
jgi:biotin carboxyl carrier protein